MRSAKWSVLLCLFSFVFGEPENGPDKRQIHHGPTTLTPGTSSHSNPMEAWLSSSSLSKPNVLFLIADDLRPKLGCYGDTNMVTPNIDFLASKSVLFRSAYAQVALCAPSRTSFLTGRRPDTTRVYDLDTYFREVSGNYTTLPQFFKNHGYYTQGVGKIFHPGSSSGNDDKLYSWTNPVFHGHDPFSASERQEAAYRPVNASQHANHLQDQGIADFAINFLSTYSQPFFLAVGFHKPHLPWVFPEEYLDLYPLSHIHLAQHRQRPAGLPDIAWSAGLEVRSYHDVASLNLTHPDDVFPDAFQKKLRQGYSAATSFMDAQLGRVLKALAQSHHSANTVVVFLGDHGWHLGDNAEWCKHTNFEMALRIPMMLYVPEVTSRGHNFDFIDALAPDFHRQPLHLGPMHVTDELVEAIDLYPTLAQLAGLPLPHTCPQNSQHVATCTEGTSLVPLVEKVRGFSQHPNMQWKKAAFSQYMRNQGSQHPVMGYSMRTSTHRYTEWVRFDESQHQGDFSSLVARELYDHNADPFEFHNLADVSSHSAQVVQLSQLLQGGWRKAQQDYLATLSP